MDRQFRLAAGIAAVLIAMAVGVVSYNVGVSHGLAVSIARDGAPAGVPMPYWYRPWGFGVFGPFAFILFWFLVLRMVFWGGFYRRRWYHRGPYDVPPRFEEWHRREHERMNGQPRVHPDSGAGTV